MASREQQQDEQEERCLRLAFEKLGIEAKKIEKQRPPHPDFAVTLGDDSEVCIEVTQARDEGAAAGAGAVRSLSARVAEGIIKQGLGAWVHLGVNQGEAARFSQDKKARNRIADALVDLAAEYIRDGWTEFRPYSHAELEDREIKWLQSVSIFAVDPPGGCGASFGWVGHRRPLIVEAIAAKNEKIGGYRATCSKPVWLLVASDLGIGGEIDIHETDGRFVSAFDRTIFLEPYEGKCVFLETDPLPAGGEGG